MSKFYCNKCKEDVELENGMCPKCHTNWDEIMASIQDKEDEVEKEEPKIKPTKKERTYSSIAVILFIGGAFAIYPIGAILALIFSSYEITIATLIIGLLIMVGSIIYCFSVNDKNDKKISEKTYETIRALVTFFGIVGIIWMFVDLSNMSSGNKSSSEPKKYTACENKSNTYYKCSWSAWEDRCVCKQR